MQDARRMNIRIQHRLVMNFEVERKYTSFPFVDSRH